MARKFYLILCITVAIISTCVCDMKTLQSSQKRHSLNYIQDRSHKVIKVPHEKYDQHTAKPGNRRRINIYEATSKNVPKVSSNDPEKSPKCKNDAVYCEYANNYPQDSVNKLSQSVISSTFILGLEIPRSSLKSFSSDASKDGSALNMPELTGTDITEQRISGIAQGTQRKHVSHLKRKRINVHAKHRREMPVEPEDESDGPEMSPSCKNSLYCEEVINYPQEAVENMSPMLSNGISLQVDKLDTLDFNQRIFGVDDVPLCEAPEKLVYPQMSYDYDGNKLYVYNTKNGDGKQGFRVQECENVDCKCNSIMVGLQQGYRGRCKQFNIYRSAAVFRSSRNITLFQSQIKLPGYCACIAEPCTNDPDPDNSLPKCDSD